MPLFTMLAIEEGVGPEIIPIVAPETTGVKAEGATLATVFPVVFVTVMTKVAVPPVKRQAGLFVMAAVNAQLRPDATLTAEDVKEVDVLDVPETEVQLAPVLAQAVNWTVFPTLPVRV